MTTAPKESEIISIEEMYRKMTDDDKKNSAMINFDTLTDEIKDVVDKLNDMILFGKANPEEIAIIDVTLTTVYDTLHDGLKCIDEKKGIKT